MAKKSSNSTRLWQRGRGVLDVGHDDVSVNVPRRALIPQLPLLRSLLHRRLPSVHPIQNRPTVAFQPRQYLGHFPHVVRPADVEPRQQLQSRLLTVKPWIMLKSVENRYKEASCSFSSYADSRNSRRKLHIGTLTRYYLVILPCIPYLPIQFLVCYYVNCVIITCPL